MPVQRCTRRGSKGWKWGDAGFCYIGPRAKAKAERQGQAIEANKRNDALSPETSILARVIADRRVMGIKTIRRVPTWRLPLKVEAEYRRQLVGIVNTMERTVNQIVVPRLEDIVVQSDALKRRDAWPTDLRKLFQDATFAIESRTIAEDRLASLIAVDTAQFNDMEWRRIVKSALGVNVFGSEPWLNAELISFTQQNVGLIKSIKSDSIRDIEGMVQQGIRAGDRHTTIAKNIKNKFQTTRRRAQFIARDQVSKLNGQLTQYRQTDLGVTHYIWRTSDDERVRQSHRDKDDRRFAWNDPPSDTGHVGQDFGCRCWAEPDFGTIFDEVPETETPLSTSISSVKVGDESVETKGLPSTIQMTGPDKSATSWVQTSTVNRAWRRGPGGYVQPGGADLKKRRALINYLKRNGNEAPLNMPVVQVNSSGELVVLQGKETFALLRDLGVKQMPVRLVNTNVTSFARTFGLGREGTKIGLRNVKGVTTIKKAVSRPKRASRPKPAPRPVAPQPSPDFIPPTSAKGAKSQLE